MNVSCPHCAGELINTSEVGGYMVTCTHCGNKLKMPPYEVPQAQYIQPQQHVYQQPTVVNVHARRHPPRVDAGGWFTRGFSATAGILIAIFVVTVVAPMVLCLGCGAIFDASDASRRIRERRENEARPKPIRRFDQ